MRFVSVSEQTAYFFPYIMLHDWLFVTETESAYCTVQIGSLSTVDFISSLKG
jgi:hypothetical protein